MGFCFCSHVPFLVPENVAKQNVAAAPNITGTTGSEVASEGRNQDPLIQYFSLP